jgi:hypothetical protein
MQVSLFPDAQNPDSVRIALELREESTERRTSGSSEQHLFSRRFALRNAPRS